jgi:hypothetical protein
MFVLLGGGSLGPECATQFLESAATVSGNGHHEYDIRPAKDFGWLGGCE